MSATPVKITLYRWAGQWGPFKVKIPCGECTLTLDVIKDVLETDLAGIPVELEVQDWLSNWWKPLPKGGWHAPIVMVENRVIAQGAALNRGVLTEEVIKVWTARSEMTGTVMFGKESCPHCQRAKGYLAEAGVNYTYFDVVKHPRALYEMVPRVKDKIGHKTPVTVPQIWIDGDYVGGADDLGKRLGRTDIEPNPERGANSLQPQAA
ncbi:MAG: glutaredoxin family protein [Rhodothalassiaceae bacterium]